MKKRIALAAAIALAISVGGMFPAFAAKPTAPAAIVSDSCVRAGGTLEVRADSATGGSTTAPAGNVTLSVADGVLQVSVDGVTNICSADYRSWTLLTSVVVSAEGSITFDLEGKLVDGTTGTDQFANYHSVVFTTAAATNVVLDGQGLGNQFFAASATVTEETFTIGTLTGTYYAGSAFKFFGGAAADSLDASGVTTTDVVADGGAGSDTLKGGAGDDTLTGGTGDDYLYGNAGDDTMLSADGGDCNKTKPNENSSNSALKCRDTVGSSGNDESWGGAGNDSFTADGGDIVAPGDGIDGFVSTTAIYQLVYADSSAAITLNLKDAPGIVKSAGGDDYYGSVAVDEFVGSELADTMIGADARDDVFYGGSGADKLVGYAGADFLSGNGGADAMKGGKGADVLLGDTGADLMNGGADNDAMHGGGGDDIMYGSTGDDVLRGEKGSDQAWGGRGTFDVCAAEVTDSCEFKK